MLKIVITPTYVIIYIYIIDGGGTVNSSGISIHPEDGCSKVLRNVGLLPQDYTVSQPRRPRLGT
jgi:hypothetical protein